MASKAVLNRTIQLQKEKIKELEKLNRDLTNTKCPECNAVRKKKFNEEMKKIDKLNKAIVGLYNNHRSEL